MYKRQRRILGRRLGRWLAREPRQDDVGDEAPYSGCVLADDDRRPFDPFVFQQHRLDLAGFDPVAPDLDLVVDPAQALHQAVGGPAGDVAGAVHACAGAVGEGVGDEAARGGGGLAEVAPGQARAGHVQLAPDPDGHGVEVPVQDVERAAGHRAADGGPLGAGEVAVRRVDGALGGAVEVVRGESVGVPQNAPQVWWYGLAADAEHLQVGLPVAALGDEFAQQGRGQLDELDAVPGEEVP